LNWLDVVQGNGNTSPLAPAHVPPSSTATIPLAPVAERRRGDLMKIQIIAILFFRAIKTRLERSSLVTSLGCVMLQAKNMGFTAQIPVQ